MLSKFSVTNFYSINDEVVLNFNFPSNRADSFQQNVLFEYKNPNKHCILNGGIIFGANASGKTNVIQAIGALKKFIEDSYKFNEKSQVTNKWMPFRFSEVISKITKFKVETIINLGDEKESWFIVNYELDINIEDYSINYEKITYSEILKTKLAKEILIFERKKDEIMDYSNRISNVIRKLEQDNITHKAILSLFIYDINRKFFEKETNSIEYKIIQKFYEDFIQKISFRQRNANRMFMESLKTDENYKKYIIKSLKKFDFAIKELEVEDVTNDIKEFIHNLEDISDENKSQLFDTLNSRKEYRTSTYHKINNKNIKLPLDFESRGTRKFLTQSYSMYESLINEGLFIADEFESAYHHKIQEGIINNFINQEGKAQFIIVSHNPLLLNKELFAKEQINFTEKNRKKESTELYLLSDFDVSYNNHSWINLYYEGRFGAVPEVLF